MSTRTYIISFIVALAGVASTIAAPAASELAPSAVPAVGSTALAVPLTREKLISTLSRDLSAHFNFEGDLELELLRPWMPPAQVASTWTIEITEYPTVAGSEMLVRCRVIADNDVVDEPTFVLHASLWRDAWAARTPLTTGTAFDPSELEARRVDVLRERDALPATVGDHSYIFTRGVSAGRLLTWRDIARRPLVKRGDMVEVSAIDGKLIVTMKGLAMENGAQGDIVTVRNPESRKDFSATVIDENRVKVSF